MRSWTLVLAVMISSVLPSPAWAYRSGLHFYLTYILAHHCGLNEVSFSVSFNGSKEVRNHALLVAWGAGSVDEFPETSPGAKPNEWLDSDKVPDRKVFHFPVPKGEHYVVRNTSQARNIEMLALEDAKAGQIDPVLFGIGVHLLQDSWSHEGYDAYVGHEWTSKPDFPHHDVPKSLEMAQVTWEVLGQWSQTVGGRACIRSFDELKPRLVQWLSEPATLPSTLRRSWERNAESVAGFAVTSDELDEHPQWQRWYRRDALRIKHLNQDIYRPSFLGFFPES